MVARDMTYIMSSFALVQSMRQTRASQNRPCLDRRETRCWSSMSKFAIVLRRAAAGLILAAAMLPHNAIAASAAPIVWVGLDDNIYHCSGDCAKPECITCH